MPERLLLGIQQGCIKLCGWSTTYVNGMPAVVSAVTRRFRLAMRAWVLLVNQKGAIYWAFRSFTYGHPVLRWIQRLSPITNRFRWCSG